MGQQVELQTSKGNIRIELDEVAAPESSKNFLAYVRKGHYDGTVFHRVIKGFMVQGGGFEAGMKQKPTDAPIRNEAGNGLKNDRYTLAMARTSDPHSATAQFFINATDNTFLNFKSESPSGWGYAATPPTSRASTGCRCRAWSAGSSRPPASPDSSSTRRRQPRGGVV